MNPTVPAAPKRPCAVDDRSTGLPPATTANRAGNRIANPVDSRRMSGIARSRVLDKGVADPGDDRGHRSDDDEHEPAPPIDDPAGQRRQDQDRDGERRERRADQVETRPERRQEERPDDLVSALGERAAGVDHDRRDQQPVQQARRLDAPGGRSGRRRPSAVPRLTRPCSAIATARSPLRRGSRWRPGSGGLRGPPPRRPRLRRRTPRRPARRRTPRRRRTTHRGRRSPARTGARPSAPHRTGRTPRPAGPPAWRRRGSRAPPGRTRPWPGPRARGAR